eukprot:TRINITY_DN3942_c0_g3_i1.p1 TRINITY_DN3942_c0_g3~~TRINITY_DN3942_c0_g3_i1.p1  ORF type:complete len:438 (+),score=90.19 TRINITY_DN3942_c0_g3_i1:409-1722(+)
MERSRVAPDAAFAGESGLVAKKMLAKLLEECHVGAQPLEAAACCCKPCEDRAAAAQVLFESVGVAAVALPSGVLMVARATGVGQTWPAVVVDMGASCTQYGVVQNGRLAGWASTMPSLVNSLLAECAQEHNMEGTLHITNADLGGCWRPEDQIAPHALCALCSVAPDFAAALHSAGYWNPARTVAQVKALAAQQPQPRATCQLQLLAPAVLDTICNMVEADANVVPSAKSSPCEEWLLRHHWVPASGAAASPCCRIFKVTKRKVFRRGRPPLFGSIEADVCEFVSEVQLQAMKDDGWQTVGGPVCFTRADEAYCGEAAVRPSLHFGNYQDAPARMAAACAQLSLQRLHAPPQAVVLAGGWSPLAGLRERLRAELHGAAGDVVVPPGGPLFAAARGAQLAAAETAADDPWWLTRREYDEQGAERATRAREKLWGALRV